MWIKICGVTTIDDASMIAEAGANAIGLNFYSRSKRYISPRAARSIRDAVARQIDVVGVFVNSPADEVADIVQSVGLRGVQFHGDESVENISAFHRCCPQTVIVRAYRVGSAGIGGMIQSIQQLTAAGIPLAAVLVDALVQGEYGGTGHQVDAGLLQNRPPEWPRLILAGGLNPQTVGPAVRAVRPWGIDTASGVEHRPGVKCRETVGQFIHAARPISDGTASLRLSQ